MTEIDRRMEEEKSKITEDITRNLSFKTASKEQLFHQTNLILLLTKDGKIIEMQRKNLDLSNIQKPKDNICEKNQVKTKELATPQLSI